MRAVPGHVCCVSLAPDSNLELTGNQHGEVEVLPLWTVDIFAARDAAPFRALPKRSFWAKSRVQEKKATMDCIGCSCYEGGLGSLVLRWQVQLEGHCFSLDQPSRAPRGGTGLPPHLDASGETMGGRGWLSLSAWGSVMS